MEAKITCDESSERCTICKNTYERNDPYIYQLSCQHYFCYPCLKSMDKKDGKLICPLDKKLHTASFTDLV